MDHNEIRHKLSEYIDGAVSPQERAAIDDHLKSCPACSDALAELRKTIEQVKQIEEVEAPAWMTAKIMAKVRDEQNERSGILNRLAYYFIPGRAIQVATVLFLTVTAYYIYSSIHPSEKYAEPPLGQLAKQERPAEVRDEAKRKAPAREEQQEKQREGEAAPAPHTPGYKSLDMKYSYEKPAPPAPAEPSSPAAAAKQAMPQEELDDASRAARPTAPKAASPSKMAEQTAPSGAVRSDSSMPEKKVVRRQTEPSLLGFSGKKDASQAGDRSKEEAERINAVTEHFVHKDLPKAMKVKGLSFTTYKYREDLPGLEWIKDTRAVKRNPCRNSYLVDVALNARSLKYLYCYDTPQIKRIGIYELANGVWAEKK